MTHRFTRTVPVIFAASAILALVGLSAPAQARGGDDEYCREYTRTVMIGGRTQEAYGTACYQPDGSWMIVGEGLGNDIPDNVNDVRYIIHDDRRDFTPTRVVYYTPRNAPYYGRRGYGPNFIWYDTGHIRNGHTVVYKPHPKWHKKAKYKHRHNTRHYDPLLPYYVMHDDRPHYDWRDRDDGSSLEIRYRYED